MSLFHLCLLVLASLSLAILISLREPAGGTEQHKSEVVQSYLSNPEMLRVLIEKQKNRTMSRSRGTSSRDRFIKQEFLENKGQKFDRIIMKMRKEKKEKKEKEVVENKYVKRNRKIQEIFSKRLDKIEEYCKRYKKGQKMGIRGIKPHAATKSFSLEPKSHLITCRTAKHGSTSWTNNFVQIYKGKKSSDGTQKVLRDLERRAYRPRDKSEIISSLQSGKHNYTAFFVCRNPVDKLLSVYNYLMDARTIESPLVMKVAGRSDFQGPHVPSWLEYLHLVAESKQKNYLGLLLPVYLGCDPCSVQYDAVVRMETFNADSRTILREVGQEWVAPAHFNNHGNNAMNKMKLWKMFKGSTVRVIRQIIVKYQKDFEICGYEETLDGLRKIAKVLE